MPIGMTRTDLASVTETRAPKFQRIRIGDVPISADESHGVQLRLPYVSTTADTDETAAIAPRRSILPLASSNRWWVGAAHLPSPGLGHVRRGPDRYTWVPISHAPVVESSTELSRGAS